MNIMEENVKEMNNKNEVFARPLSDYEVYETRVNYYMENKHLFNSSQVVFLDIIIKFQKINGLSQKQFDCFVIIVDSVWDNTFVKNNKYKIVIPKDKNVAVQSTKQEVEKIDIKEAAQLLGLSDRSIPVLMLKKSLNPIPTIHPKYYFDKEEVLRVKEQRASKGR